MPKDKKYSALGSSLKKKFMSIEAKNTLLEVKGLLDELNVDTEKSSLIKALSFAALLGIKPRTKLSDMSQCKLGITEIISFANEYYFKRGKKDEWYKPNSRESFRDEAVAVIEYGGGIISNLNESNRATNDRNYCYEVPSKVIDSLKEIVKTRGGNEFKAAQNKTKEAIKKQKEEFKKAYIPIKFDGKMIELSPGEHNKLIKQIVIKFRSKFCPNAELLYVGDTRATTTYCLGEKFSKLGFTIDFSKKLPDVILYECEKKWLFIIEAVNSGGHLSSQRVENFRDMFQHKDIGLIFVSAYHTRKSMLKYMTTTSWETEVWVAENPAHMIHFNGDKFFGPHTE